MIQLGKTSIEVLQILLCMLLHCTGYKRLSCKNKRIGTPTTMPIGRIEAFTVKSVALEKPSSNIYHRNHCLLSILGLCARLGWFRFREALWGCFWSTVVFAVCRFISASTEGSTNFLNSCLRVETDTPLLA